MRDRPERLSTRRAYEGRFLNVDIETIKNPVGQTVDLEIIRHPGAAAVIPFVSDTDSADPYVLLLRQYRYAAEGMIWEIPAGVLEPDESPVDCARRELEEETGATARNVEHLTTIYTTPGFTDERIHLFLATGLEVGETNHEDDELIYVESRPLSKVLEMIREWRNHRREVDRRTPVRSRIHPQPVTGRPTPETDNPGTGTLTRDEAAP